MPRMAALWPLSQRNRNMFFSGPQSLKENPQGRFFPHFGMFFFCSKFLLVAKKNDVCFSPRKNVGSWGRWSSQLQTLILLKLPLRWISPMMTSLWVPGGHVQIPPSRVSGEKTNHGVFSRKFMGFFVVSNSNTIFWHPKNVVICKNPWEVV